MGAGSGRQRRDPDAKSRLSRGDGNPVRELLLYVARLLTSEGIAGEQTGRIPSQHGIHDWLRGGNIGDDAIEYLAGQSAYTEILARNGYVCGLSGKWHLGDSITPQKGYSHWFAHQSGGGPYSDAPMIRGGKLINQPGYLTDDALAFLDECATEDAPFHLSVHYTAPHSPWVGEHPQDIVDSYDDCPFNSCPQEPEHPWSLRNTCPRRPDRIREPISRGASWP